MGHGPQTGVALTLALPFDWTWQVECFFPAQTTRLTLATEKKNRENKKYNIGTTMFLTCASYF